MRRGPWLAIGGALVGAGCEPSAAECGDSAPAVGVFCFPDEAVIRVGRGFAPAAMAVLDVDDDGALDVVAVNPSRETLTIHWGDADGGLSRMSSWPLAQEVAGVAHADLDGDGREDLATALPGGDAVAVLYNRGGREFQLRMHATGEAPRGLLAAQLEDEGPAALITANVGDGSVSVLRRGVVGAPTIVGGGPQALASGDFDGDGALDVAVALRDDDAVQVLHNRGGALITGARHGVGTTPTALVAGDLDGDGAVDLASADRLGDTVSVIFGDGVGGARATARWPVERLPTGLVIVRGGGVLPVLGVLSEETSTVARLDPRAGTRASAATLGPAGAIAAGDLDRDGREELLHGAGSGGAIAALRPGVGLTLTPRGAAGSQMPECALDLDGDGVDELIGRAEDGMFSRIGDPEARGWASGLMVTDGCRGVDARGDGREGLLMWGEAASDAGGLTLLWPVDGGWATQFVLSFPGRELGVPVVGDALGDGSIDLVVSGRRGADGELWLVSGLMREGGPDAVIVEEGRGHDLVAIDLDGDAALDVAGIRDGALMVMHGVGSGEPWRVVANVVAGYGSLVAGDFDGDGVEDLLLVDGTVVLRPGGPSPVILAGSGEETSSLAVIDLDVDGDVDVVARQYVRDRAALTLLMNDGSGGFTARGRHDLSGSVLAPVRLADGEIAVVTRDPLTTEVLTLALGVGEVLEERAGTVLEVTRPGAFADLDGDGVLDTYAGGPALAVSFGVAGGLGPTHHVPAWDVALDGGVVAPAPLLRWVAAGDVDGDGAAELVLLHAKLSAPDFPLTALTVVRVTGAGVFEYEGLGSLAGDFLRVFVRDLDGDGNADLLLGGATGRSYLRGRGDGGFEPALTQMGEGAALPIGLQAIDGDDRLDLLLYEEDGARLLWARGQGNGGFDEARPWWSGSLLSVPLAADVGGDGRVDLVTNTVAGLTVFAGTGKGLGAGRVVHSPYEVLALAVADLDGDGGRELLAAMTGKAEYVMIVQGRSAGAGYVFTRRVLERRHPYGEPLELLPRDVDGDGAIDVALMDGEGMTIVRQRP